MSGTTNFLQFNPTQANQETDAEYSGDATRTSGALDGNAWPAASANKTLYQAATMVSALGQMLANKGYSVSDANYSALVTQLANILTTNDARFGLQNLSWSSNITLNAQTFTAFAVPLQGSTALSLTNVVAGQVYTVLYSQDSAGSHTVTFGAGFGAGATQPDPGANTLSAQLFLADATLTLRPVGPLVSHGGINNTPVGNGAPSTGVFTTLTLAAGAPVGYVLTGDGVSYVPAPAPSFTSGSSSTGHWAKDPSGLIYQWGSYASASGAAYTLVLPTSFSTSSYSLVTTGTFDPASGAQIRDTVYITSQSAATATIDTDGSSMAFNWMAVGY